MSWKAVSGVMLTLLLISMLTLAFNIHPAKMIPTTIVVPDDYATIQQAIDNAYPSNTIYVKAGTYHENLILNKPDLTLIGENRNITVIHGDQYVVSIEANNVKVSGFTIINGSIGVRTSPWTHGHIISGNIIMNNSEGINGHYDVYNITISDNIINLNKFHGIGMCFYNSIISDNVISNNGKGNFIELTAGIAIGVGVNNKTIYSNNNMIIRNVIENNYNGILSAHYSEGNVFYHNTFIDNAHQIQPSVMNNTLEENYWSDYTGEDKDGDGFGDTPYIISIGVKDNLPLMSPFFYWNNPIDGDINKDMKVDIRDIAIVSKAFGSYLGHQRWNPIADVNQDNKVDLKDVGLIAKNFGKAYP